MVSGPWSMFLFYFNFFRKWPFILSSLPLFSLPLSLLPIFLIFTKMAYGFWLPKMVMVTNQMSLSSFLFFFFFLKMIIWTLSLSLIYIFGRHSYGSSIFSLLTLLPPPCKRIATNSFGLEWSKGAIKTLGIVGAVVVVILLLGIIHFCWKKCHTTQPEHANIQLVPLPPLPKLP